MMLDEERMIDFRPVSPYAYDAQTLMAELSESLTGIVGKPGTAFLNLDDFTKKRSVFFVGYIEDLAVCCAGVREFDKTTGEVRRVYARRNQDGIGTALLLELERWGRAQGFSRLVLESRERNVHAIEFYKKNGYRVCPNYGPYVNE